MMSPRGWLSRVVSSFRRPSLDDRLEDEIELHLEMATNDNIARGMPPGEARYAAIRSFGGIVKTREAYRETAGWPVLDALWQDVRYAVRAYRRTPGFALVVVVTLALAIGANTAIFSLLNALALRDLPVRDPGTLVHVSTVTPLEGQSFLTFSMFRELSARQLVFTSVIGTSGNTGVEVSDGGTVMRGLLWAATGNVYEELGVRPVAGRLLAAGDMSVDPPGAEAVAVLGYGFWQRHYGGDDVCHRTNDTGRRPILHGDWRGTRRLHGICTGLRTRHHDSARRQAPPVREARIDARHERIALGAAHRPIEARRDDRAGPRTVGGGMAGGS